MHAVLCHDGQEMGLVVHNTTGLDSKLGLKVRNKGRQRKVVHLESPDEGKFVQESHTECDCG